MDKYQFLVSKILWKNTWISFVHQKSLIQRFNTCFWLNNNLWEFTTHRTQIQKMILYSKLVLNVRFKAFWYTKRNPTQVCRIPLISIKFLMYKLKYSSDLIKEKTLKRYQRLNISLYHENFEPKIRIWCLFRIKSYPKTQILC